MDDLHHVTSTPSVQLLQNPSKYSVSAHQLEISNTERGSPRRHNIQLAPKRIVKESNADLLINSPQTLTTNYLPRIGVPTNMNAGKENCNSGMATPVKVLNVQRSIPPLVKGANYPPQTRELRRSDRTLKKNESRKRNASHRVEKSNKRSRRVKAPENFKVPLPEELPPVVYEFDDKPPFSYATLIGMALLRSPTRKLTLSQIYHWIYSHFHYYRKGEVGWQNSIRHNLSLNESFEKAEKSKDGKGHYWRIVSGFEYQFCHVQQTRKLSTTETKSKKCKVKKANSQLQSALSSIASLHMTTASVPVDIATTPIQSQVPRTPHVIASQGRTPRTLGFPAEGLGSAFKQCLASPDDPSVRDSPRALPFTSSFNCKSTFEVSPLPNTTYSGPLWEPLTPKKNMPDGKETQQIDEALAPKLKTPINTMQTPLLSIGSSSVIRKLWTSPSYLDDFYASPIANNETSDNSNVSVYKTIYGSPLVIKSERTKVKNQRLKTNAQAIKFPSTPRDSCQKLEPISKESKGRSPVPTINGYTTNQIFGIDIGVINHDEDRLK